MGKGYRQSLLGAQYVEGGVTSGIVVVSGVSDLTVQFKNLI